MESESILTSVKKVLGIEEDYEHFDVDIVMHINSILMVLRRLGVGSGEVFTISDKTATWKDFLGDDANELAAVKSYVCMRVRLMFDPPTSSALLDSMKRTVDELEWRLNDVGEAKTPPALRGRRKQRLP